MSTRQKILAGLITILALIALSVSAYLTWQTLQAKPVAGCTAEAAFDCEDVLASRWSKWFGLPVSLFGAITYTAILALCWPAAIRPGGIAMTMLFTLALIAGGAAVWFVGLQVFHLHSFCLYCMTVHTCGLLVAILALLMLSGGAATTDYNQMRSLLGVAAAEAEPVEPSANVQRLSGPRLIAALAVSALSLSTIMGGQLLSEPDTPSMEEIDLPLPTADDSTNNPKPSVDQSSQDQIAKSSEENSGEDSKANAATEQQLGEEEDEFQELTDLPSLAANALGGEEENGLDFLDDRHRYLAFAGLQEKVDTQSMPILGNPQAKHMVVKLMDYTCTHCRKLHPHLQAAVDHYGDQLAVIIYHVPLSKKCNPQVKRDYPGKSNACDYANLAIGVWKLAPEKFAQYHDWLLESEKAPGIYEARRRAWRLVGDDILLDKKVKANTGKRIAGQTAAFARLNVGLPVLLFTNGAMRGAPDDQEQFFQYLEGKLGIQPSK